jgi:predicted nucleotidyltransferase
LKYSAIDTLAEACSGSWTNIAASRAGAEVEREKIRSLLKSRRLVPSDTAFVVFGSLARCEWTSGSDIDWTLLVDGEARENHLTAAQGIRSALVEAGYKPPSDGGVFGGTVFSHELVHRIGGEPDSNRNTTQRILLLLESACLAAEDHEVRERVILQVLKRYVEDDYGYRPPTDWQPYVPRFFLNDVVRYWRTMAVDFAAKRREREGDGWAIRNIKLRMSRKLLFVAGLAMALSCKLQPSPRLKVTFESDEQFCSAMTGHLQELSDKAPLEILAQWCVDFSANDAARQIFEAYDRFLELLAGKASRDHLKTLTVNDVQNDELFSTAREIAESFQGGLTKLFFATDETLREHTQRYGVF